MNKKLDKLIYILKNAGFDEEAEQVEKTKRMSIKMDPMSVAVSLGLLPSHFLSTLNKEEGGLKEEGHEEDMGEFRELLEAVKKQYDDLD